MFEKLSISGFKGVECEDLDFKGLTVLTGVNSSGKSTILQSLLVTAYFSGLIKNVNMYEYVANFADFSSSRNKHVNAKEILISVVSPNGNTRLKWELDSEVVQLEGVGADLDFENNVHYLSAHRIGPEEFASYNPKMKCGLNGEFLFGFFDQKKDEVYNIGEFKCADSQTLKFQVNWWLQYILDSDFSLASQKIATTKVKVTFSTKSLPDLNPFNVGSGNSYVAKILILCLSCLRGETVIIENPEIHLHPKAQAKLGEFFYFIAKNGVQVVLETHCEHLINKIRYEAYKDKSYNHFVSIYYKEDERAKFNRISISSDGMYVDGFGNKIDFPSGFFDSTLDELMELPH